MSGGMNAQAPCVILNEPQLAENIGAVARVMANFGLIGPASGPSARRLAADARLGQRVGRRLAAGRRPGVRHSA